MRRKVQTRIEGTSGETLSSVVCYLLRVGAQVVSGATVPANGTASIGLKHPGALKLGDEVYWITSSGAATGNYRVTTDPSFSGGTWSVTLLDLSGSETTISNTGRLALQWGNSAHHVTWYDNDTSATGTLGLISPSAVTGALSFYVEEPDIDIAVTQNGVLSAYFTDVPVERREFVTPEEFGAVGNGSTDDTNAIQAAIDYVGSLGDSRGFVYIPTGTYLVSSQIDLKSNVKVFGDGPFKTRILCSSATASVFSGNSASLFELGGMEIYFTTTRTAGHAIVAANCGQFRIKNIRMLAPFQAITLTTCNDVLIDDVVVTTGTGGWQRGVYLDDCVSVELRRVICTWGNETPSSACFMVESDCDTIEFYDCGAGGAGGTGNAIGFRVLNSTSTGGGVPPRWVKFFGCVAEGGSSSDYSNAQNGWVIDAGTSIQLVSCYAATSRNGLVINGGNGVTVLGGEFFANGQHGISIAGGSGVKISGAQIHNNSRQTATSYDGINVASGVSDFSIVDCDIGTETNYGTTSAHRYDIVVSTGASDKYRIIGNRCKDGSTGKLVDNGTGTNKEIGHNVEA